MTENGVGRLPMAMHGCGSARPSGGQFLVRVGDGEAPLVIFDDLAAGVAGRDPRPETGDVESEDIAAGGPLDHPFGKGQANPAALAKAGHHGAGGPVIAQARHRSHQGVAIRRKGERAIDHSFNAGVFKNRKPSKGLLHGRRDPVQAVGQKFGTEIGRRAVHRPRLARLLIEPDQQTAPLRPEIGLAGRIKDLRRLLGKLINLRQIIGHQILMLHRMQGQVNAR